MATCGCLAEEAQGFEWETEGLRLVGEAQFRLKAFRGARETFETLRKAVPDDVRANLRLGTIYQKLAAMASLADKEEFLSALGPGHSPRARRVPRRRTAPRPFRCSEAMPRRDGWTIGATSRRRHAAEAALHSAHLVDALDSYLNAYAEDLAGFYPGVNALAMLKIQGDLAKRAPDAWEAAFAIPTRPEARSRSATLAPSESRRRST